MEYSDLNRDRFQRLNTSHRKLDLHSTRGFTLIELMIVVAIIGIISGIAIPNLVQSRAVANQGAVVGTLRAISTAQFNFKSMGLVDVDNNGGYEFGTIGEMAAGRALREVGGQILSPSLLPPSLDRVEPDGRLRRHGYYFQLYLPDAAGVGVAETAAGMPTIDSMLAGEYWTLLAWPLRRGATGTATYFINQQGDVVKSTAANYSGLASIPPAGAALLGTANANLITSSELAVRTVGADGETWVPVQ